MIVVIVIIILSILSFILITNSKFYFPTIISVYYNEKLAKTDIKSFIARQFNHKLSGLISQDDFKLPHGYKENIKVVHIGFGLEEYNIACNILKRFDMVNQLSWAKVLLDNPKNDIDDYYGLTGATIVKCYGIVWTLNPFRVIKHINNRIVNNKLFGYNINRYSEISYSTLEGHLLEGEERYRVILSSNNNVLFELYSYSKGNGILGKLVNPFVIPLQKSFFNSVPNKMISLMKLSKSTE